MPIYRHFYVECSTADGWRVPPAFEPPPGSFECDRQFGGFAWAHPRSGWLDLFFGDCGLFRMRPGPPDDRRGSPLCRYIESFADAGGEEHGLSWLPYPELLIDQWETEPVTVRAMVPNRHAQLFGDGRQLFPHAELLRAGMSESELARLHEGSLCDAPLDITSGPVLHRVAESPPDRTIPVTWRESVAEYVGKPMTDAFRGLRRYGRDVDLRILSRLA